MARCYQLTPVQSQQWNEGGWLSLEIQDDIVEWAERYAPHQPMVVVTHDHKICFALTAHGEVCS